MREASSEAIPGGRATRPMPDDRTGGTSNGDLCFLPAHDPLKIVRLRTAKLTEGRNRVMW